MVENELEQLDSIGIGSRRSLPVQQPSQLIDDIEAQRSNINRSFDVEPNQLPLNYRRIRYSSMRFMDWLKWLVNVLFAVLRSSVLLVTYLVVKSIELKQEEDIERQKFVEKILLLYGMMQLSTIIFVSSQIMRRRTSYQKLFYLMLFVYYTFMFFGFLVIIKIAINSWIPGLPNQLNDEETPENENVPPNNFLLPDSVEFERSQKPPESAFIYALYVFCKVGNSFVASVVLFIMLWIGVGVLFIIHHLYS